MSANERARRETLASGRAQVSGYIGGAKRNGIRVAGGVGGERSDIRTKIKRASESAEAPDCCLNRVPASGWRMLAAKG